MVGNAQPWFTRAITEGMQMLVTLSLPGTPPAETISLTADVWIQTLWSGSAVWEEATDVCRLRAAFLSVARSIERWPAPRLVIDHLPARPERPKLGKPPVSPEQAARNYKRLHKMLRPFLEKTRGKR